MSASMALGSSGTLISRRFLGLLFPWRHEHELSEVQEYDSLMITVDGPVSYESI